MHSIHARAAADYAGGTTSHYVFCLRSYSAERVFVREMTLISQVSAG
jgi:hypothetical protein